MICPIEIAGDLSAFQAVRVGEHGWHVLLLEGRDGAGDESTGSHLASHGEEDHVVASSGDHRHMRRWREGYQEFGYDGLFDRRRGKPSPKRVPLAVVEQVLALYRDRYLDLNVRHFHEKLSDQHQIELSYSWVKQALQGAGLVARGRKRGVHRKRRPRRPLPGMLLVTEGRVHESRVARTLRFDPGTIVVFDRGYTDYAWFSALDGVYFVTRIKDNADYGVLERRPVPERGPVQRDEIIFLYKLARRGEPDLFLRRIEVWDEAQGRTLVFLTNHRRFAASTIAAIYRQRWQIELFFKALKQNLRIKTFVGTSANALQIQVWTALIALLLLKYLQLRARFGWSLSNLAALLRQQLFVYRDLFSWIDQPFQPPPQLAHIAEQIPLSW